MHLVVLSTSLVNLPVFPPVLSFALLVKGSKSQHTVHHVVPELSLKNSSVREFQLPFPFLFPSSKVACKNSAVGSGLCSSAFLHVFYSLAVVARTVVADVQSDAMGLVIFEVPLVCVSVWVANFTLPVCFVIFPLSLVFCPILPELNSEPFSFLILRVYLASVYAPIIILDSFDWIFYWFRAYKTLLTIKKI